MSLELMHCIPRNVVCKIRLSFVQITQLHANQPVPGIQIVNRGQKIEEEKKKGDQLFLLIFPVYDLPSSSPPDLCTGTGYIPTITILKRISKQLQSLSVEGWSLPQPRDSQHCICITVMLTRIYNPVSDTIQCITLIEQTLVIPEFSIIHWILFKRLHSQKQQQNQQQKH